MKLLTIALPKGKLFKPAIEVLAAAGLPVEFLLDGDSRKLVFQDDDTQVRYMICRPTDIPTFVEYGAADLGMVGKDTIVEQAKDVSELVDLEFGYCRFVVAAPKAKIEKNPDLKSYNYGRVATKFPKVAADFFKEKGMQMEIIKLHGNIELAPVVGLSDLIVDIVSTGKTLKENDLVPVAEIFSSTTRLIANRASSRMKYQRIQPLVAKIKEYMDKRESNKND
ncbi:ATP phosphoribosyltransferase [Desulfitispora alkaliphila]|uniref:ATP phosphoribosyltransferase n=1 Tax=Desulfitispora alkaliphila TaxID=622674 RepID=UPI003D2311B9